MATLAQLRTRVSSKLGLDNSAGGEKTLLDSWANEGVEDVLVRTHCRVREATLALTAGTETYTLDSSIMAVIDVYNTTTDVDYQMERVPPDYLNRLRRNGTGAVGPATYYTLQGTDLLKLWPTPGSGETLRMDYVPRPGTLSLDADTPSEIPVRWHKAVELYMLWQGADYDDDTSSAQGDRYRRDYLTYLEDMKRIPLQRSYGRAVVNRRRVRSAPHNPSTYPAY